MHSHELAVHFERDDVVISRLLALDSKRAAADDRVGYIIDCGAQLGALGGRVVLVAVDSVSTGGFGGELVPRRDGG